MSTIGVRVAKTIGEPLKSVVTKANNSGVKMMKANGALTKAGRDLYRKELSEAGVKSLEGLMSVSKKKSAELMANIEKTMSKLPKNFDKFLENISKHKFPFVMK